MLSNILKSYHAMRFPCTIFLLFSLLVVKVWALSSSSVNCCSFFNQPPSSFFQSKMPKVTNTTICNPFFCNLKCLIICVVCTLSHNYLLDLEMYKEAENLFHFILSNRLTLLLFYPNSCKNLTLHRVQVHV